MLTPLPALARIAGTTALLCATSIPLLAQRPPGEHFTTDALRTALTATAADASSTAGSVEHEFLSPGTFTGVISRSSAGTDTPLAIAWQHEVHYVLSGRATLTLAAARKTPGASFDAAPGAVLFVPAGRQHQFTDVKEDLTTLVLRIDPQGTFMGGPGTNRKVVTQTPFHEESTRGATRIFYWAPDSSVGQVAIDFGQPEWRAAYEDFLSTPSETRWRFGENFWTVLDNNIPMTVAGTRLDVGQWYLLMQNHPEHGLRLLALDAQQTRKARWDAYDAPKTSGGLAIPLTERETEVNAPRLDLDLRCDEVGLKKAELLIHFGPHRFAAPITFEVDLEAKPDAAESAADKESEPADGGR